MLTARKLDVGGREYVNNQLNFLSDVKVISTEKTFNKDKSAAEYTGEDFQGTARERWSKSKEVLDLLGFRKFEEPGLPTLVFHGKKSTKIFRALPYFFNGEFVLSIFMDETLASTTDMRTVKTPVEIADLFNRIKKITKK